MIVHGGGDVIRAGGLGVDNAAVCVDGLNMVNGYARPIQGAAEEWSPV